MGATTPSVADLLKDLGGIPAHRVLLRPALGTATERDVIQSEKNGKRLCELVDGVLVEKVMSYYESQIAAWLIYYLRQFLNKHDLGIVAGADGMMRLAAGLVRIPDVSFVLWDRLPGRRVPREPIAGFGPDLAIEVLSKGNTKKEMARKVREYFAAGAKQVWLVQPGARTVTVFTSPGESTVLHEKQTLKGGDLLPGFSLSLRKLFARAEGRKA